MAAAKKNVEAIYRLSPTQEGILFHAIQAPGSGVYLQQFTCGLVGEMVVEDLAAAWQEVLGRHPAMRALFTWEGRENPLQVIRREVTVPFEVREDATLVAGGDALERFLAADRAAGFELTAAPLMRVAVFRGDDAQRCRLVWSFHHILLDGWSMRLFFNEVLAVYAGMRSGAKHPARPTRSYEDYIAWLGRRDAAADERFWRELLAGFDAPTDLRLRRPQAADRAHGEVEVRLPAGVTAQLVAMARTHRVTLNTVLRGAFALLLSRYSGTSDVVFGATVSGRPPGLDGAEDIVGLFINTLPVRAQVEDGRSVAAWLRAIQEQQLAISEHESTPLVEVQRASEVPAGTPLFDAILVFENHAVGLEAAGVLQVEGSRYVERSNYPLALLVVPGEELAMILIYDGSRFERAAVERLGAHLCTTLTAMAADAVQPVGGVPMLAAAETAWLVEAATEPAVPVEVSSVLELFAGQVRAHPDAPALHGGGVTVRYGELADRARSLAGALRAQGVGRDVRVALCFDRSPEMVVGILAVLFAGGAYVPMDPEWPAARVRHVLRDTAAPVILTSEARRAGLPAVGAVVLCESDPSPAITSAELPPVVVDQLAYVLYTSGSTGEPKGVEITHENLAHSTAARSAFYEEPVGRFLLLSPYHFDSSVAGLFWTLATGGVLELVPPGVERDVRELARRIEAAAVTHTLCLPSLYELLLDVAAPGELASLRTVVVAGEACHPALVTRHLEAAPGVRLVNEYGPTEATVWATAHVLDASDAAGAVPIGRPIGATAVFVLDPQGAFVARGVPGELCLGGPGLARGYANDPERTAQCFVECDIDGVRQRLYRTGDLVRMRDNGDLEFLGRVDQQVKIRGHRIELGEIEAQLAGAPNVQDAAVVVTHDDDGRARGLVAYWVARAGASTSPDLRGELARTLPEAMLPGQFVQLERLPRTSTGKLDRGALPQPGAPRPAEEVTAPVGETEATLAAIWGEVLGLPSVSTTANFFELGGDSLLSIRIIARAHQAGLRVDPARFAQAPTVVGMAAAAVDAAAPVARRAAPSGPLPLTPIQRWFFDLDLPERHHWNQAVLFDLPVGVTEGHLEQAIQAVLDRHDALRLRFASGAEGVRQEVVARVEARVEVFDLSAVPAEERVSTMEQVGTRAQAAMDLASGSLVRAVLFATGDDPRSQLLVAIHHLAVDAVSWVTLREDLAMALSAAQQGQPVELPGGAPFTEWVERLREYATSPAVAAEVSHWASLIGWSPSLPVDLDGGNPVASERVVVGALDAATTRALIEDVPATYATQIQDALLTALLRAVAPWTGSSRLLVDLEGHGREAHGADVDISRTVGWLTAVRPVGLESAPGSAVGDALKGVKEQLRAVPGGGIGYGLLRAFHPGSELAAVPKPAVLFNYLGRQDVATPEGLQLAAAQTIGRCRSDQGTRGYVLEINAEVVGGALQVRWSYSDRLHASATIEGLADRFSAELRGIVAHCRSPEAGGRTPSDFPLAGLDQAELDRLSDLFGDE